MLLAAQLDVSGRYAAAIATYRNILRKKADHLDAGARLKRLLADEKKLGAALEQLRDLQRRRPRDTEVMIEIAELAAHKGDAKEEIATRTKLVELKHSVPENLYRIGVVQRASKNPLKALAAFSKLLRISPKHFEAMADVGEVYLELGRLSQARKFFERAIETRAEFYRARMGLGRVLEEQGHFRAAIAEYRAATRLRPDDMVPLGRMERIYREALGDADRAAKLASEIRRHSPPAPKRE